MAPGKINTCSSDSLHNALHIPVCKMKWKSTNLKNKTIPKFILICT
jgi:hypothetical protein